MRPQVAISFLLGITACGTHPAGQETNFQIASQWQIASTKGPNDCAPIDGAYRNKGVLDSGNGTGRAVGRFDVALGQPLPSERSPDSIEVRVRLRTKTIQFQLIGADTTSYSRTFACSGGWYTLEENQGTKSLADGALMNYSNHLIRFAASADGGLIAHTVTNARFTTAGVARSDERVESWYRFEKVVEPAVSNQGSRPLLNSERIRQHFGSYGVEILDDEGDVRVSNLYSMERGQKITRTLAVVMYFSTMPPEILPAHLEIKNGGSIGEVFARQGWNITKRNVYFGELNTSADLSGLYARMGGIAPTTLAEHVYEFIVDKEGQTFRYATIAEIHHPDYLREADLEKIYRPMHPAGERQDINVPATLERVRNAVLNAVPKLAEAIAWRFPVWRILRGLPAIPLPGV